jgi:hypothetical protein
VVHGRLSFLPYVLLAVQFTFPLVGCSSSSPLERGDLDLLELSLRVHLMESEHSDALTTSLSAGEVDEVMAGINQVWAQAGIRWSLESLRRSEAEGDPHAFQRIVDRQLPPFAGVMAGVLPRDDLTSGAWDVFLIRELGGIAGGIYFPAIPAVLQPEVDPLGFRGLDGGLVRILSHELGHALGLPHVSCTENGNLMAPGCLQGQRTRLSDAQIEAARGQALTGPYRGGRPSF